MINFPVLESIAIDGYSLYPGTAERPGLHESLSPRLTLLIGANGLGKSTILAVLFRMLTGPNDIPGAMGDDDLGYSSTQVKALNPTQRREFAARTTDGAAESTAALRFNLGSETVVVERRLRDLKLVRGAVNDVDHFEDEQAFQETVTRLSNLPSFSDWILCLRFITFYRDDRQVLFWDRSAQRQLLRSLFLPSSDATEWVRLERLALEADSAFRNLRTYANNRQRALFGLVPPSDESHEVLARELAELLELQAAHEEQSAETMDQVRQSDERVSTSRYELLQAQLAFESASREYEHAKMTVLARYFPSDAESALYLWSQLLSGDHCLVCGTEDVGMAAQINDRIDAGMCAVCGSVAEHQEAEPSDIADARLARSTHAVESQRDAVNVLGASVREAERYREELRVHLSSASVDEARRKTRIAALQRILPASETDFATATAEIAALQVRLGILESELQVAATDFETYVDSKSVEIAQNADAIRNRFGVYASAFLVDAGDFTWSPREERIGQSEYRARFPAFELSLARSDGASVALRSGLDDVSESQKEFIDLAFRMALIDVAGSQAAGSVVIDTPESSLDTVFAERAALALAAFLRPDGKGHLVIASNVTGSQLVPILLAEARDQLDAEPLVINLFDIAESTPAVREYEERYRAAVGEMIA